MEGYANIFLKAQAKVKDNFSKNGDTWDANDALPVL